MPTPRLRIALLALTASTLSCSVLIDTTAKQCSSDTDCANLGDAFAGSMCTANVCVKPDAVGPLSALGCPMIDPSPDPTVKLSFKVSFAAASPPKPQPFEILACKRLDTPCAGPVGMITADPGALVELDVPTGFQGFLRVENPDTVSSMVFLGLPAQQDTRFWDLTIPRLQDVALIGLATSTDIDPNLSTLIMIARDCDRNPLAGVAATNSTGGTGFYFAAMAPDKTLMATTEEGAAGFTNVPGGTAILGGSFNGHLMSPTSVEARSGWFSYAEVFQ
ncbi:MAG TPA: hypothetical protein VHW01_16505 [Polyangiaceae bacterium]|nr:hypothetical protein [Polyangiaceae bacterium]